MIKDYFAIAFKNLRRRKLRAWLTMLGIFIAVATIFTLISVSVGLQQAVQEQFRLLGTDKFFILPKGQLGAPGSSGAVVQLTTNDEDVIKKIAGVKAITSVVIGNAKVEFNKQLRFYLIAGLDLKTSDLYFESTGIKPIDGRMLKQGDTKSVALGYDYKYNHAFDKPVDIGNTIKVNGVSYKVVGILSRIGNPSDDKNIYLDVNELRTLLNISSGKVDEIMVQIAPGENVKDVSTKVEKKLRTFRNVDEKTQDFTILTPDQLLQSFGTILTIITGFLLGVAGISLVVGGIGIANTMYTSVLERTKEIGTMKAVGAQNKDILLIFLFESGLLGLTGGIIGVLLGIFVSKTIEFIAVKALGTTLLKAAIPAYLIIGCLAFAFITGAVFGIWPAYRASKIRPVDALRYE